ncbi:hypothetical protein HMPREF0971_00225 [Segatella oris F0302]|uniref:Uncharacterized protein n=1 Tax=Segatella oris F0302 TaxID=649760 RepID=D1QMJ1_9BACT|nr:hypothetical protein HMPREF0971_01016 [Segatella oris F0302]EFB33462.1 hypothetical protein HMPREF0971_00225 [Segatella oris F0302]
MIKTFLIVVDNVTGGLSGFCHQAGMKTKKRKPQQLLEVSSVG